MTIAESQDRRMAYYVEIPTNSTSSPLYLDPTSSDSLQPALTMLVITAMFCVCLIVLRISFRLQRARDAAAADRWRIRTETRELRRQQEIENGIIIKKFASSTSQEDTHEKDVDIENLPDTKDGTDRTDTSKTIIDTSDSSLSETLQFCAICLCEYIDTDEVCLSRNPDCSHFFHLHCGIAWLAKHSQCPICRAEYLFEQEPLQCPLKDDESETFCQENGGTTTISDGNSSSFDIESTTVEGHDNHDER